MVVITGAVSRAKLQSNHRDSDTVFLFFVVKCPCNSYSVTTFRLQNDLYCVEWDIKLYYTIPYL